LKLLKGNQLQQATRDRAFELMRKLAGASRQLPKTYLVGKFTRCKVKKKVIANGAFADIREGRLNGMKVAIKTIRIFLEDEEKIGVIREVQEFTRVTILDD
jgi:hypothetical protein